MVQPCQVKQGHSQQSDDNNSIDDCLTIVVQYFPVKGSLVGLHALEEQQGTQYFGLRGVHRETTEMAHILHPN